MLMLVLVFCTHGHACIERRRDMSAAVPMACMIEAEREAGTWLAEHPKYKLERWRCEVNLPKTQRT